MDIHGDLTEADARRLLNTLRLVRGHLEEKAHVIVGRLSTLDPNSHVSPIEFSLGEVVDKILHEYRDFD